MNIRAIVSVVFIIVVANVKAFGATVEGVSPGGAIWNDTAGCQIYCNPTQPSASFSVSGLSDALGDVTITVKVYADLISGSSGGVSAYVNVQLGGVQVTNSISGSTGIPTNGDFFKGFNEGSQNCGTCCAFPANFDTFTVPASWYNARLTGTGSNKSLAVTYYAAPGSNIKCVSHTCNQGNCFPNGSDLSNGQQKITITWCPVASCDDGNPCTNDTCNSGTCSHSSVSNGTPCSDGVYCNGTDTCSSGSCSNHSGDPCTNGEYCDESSNVCQRVIVSSNPPDGSIDARRPHLPTNTSTTYGWNSVVLTMSGNASGITAGNFSVSSTSGTAPSVSSVFISGNDVTITLSGRIPPDAWTEITYNPGQSSICLGYLPADVDGNGTSAAADILKLIDHLNAVVSLDIWQCDIDRSGVCAPADIIDEIDLLNGANDYDVWNGASIGGSPCSGESLMVGGESDDHFADGFLAFLTATELTDAVAEGEFIAVVEGLTGWCSNHCSTDVRDEIVKSLEDESLSFQNKVGPIIVPDIIAALAN